MAIVHAGLRKQSLFRLNYLKHKCEVINKDFTSAWA